MTLKISTGLRNAMLGTGGFKETMDGGFLRFYTGTQPESADAAATGTLLVTFYSNSVDAGLNFATPANGLITKANEVWSGTSGATGTAGWFRFSDSADTPTDVSTTAKRVDGAIAISGAEVNTANVAFISGVMRSVDTFSLTLPA
jgi:hypothetical protein